MGSFAWEMSFRIFRLETFVCDPSLGNFRLELSLGSFRLGFFDLKRSLGNFRFGSFVWELSLGIFRLGTFALGSLGLGNWSPEAGGTGWLTLGEPGRTDSPDRVFEILSN